MTDYDLKKIGSLVEEKLSASEKRVLTEVDEKMLASEKRLLTEVDEKFSASEKRVLTELGRFVEDQLLPAISEKADKSDIDKIVGKLDRVMAKDSEQDYRLSQIEKVPAVAHELKSKK